MSRFLTRKYFNWFYEKITKGAEVDELIAILYIGISFHLEEIEGLIVKDDSYILSESISMIYKVANGNEVSFKYFLNILKRLKLNLIKNKKTIKLITINE